jgi:hypothetical protein
MGPLKFGTNGCYYKKKGASLSNNYSPFPCITVLLENLIPLQFLKKLLAFDAKLSVM